MSKIKQKHIYIPIITAVISLMLLIGVNFFFKSTGNKSYTEFLADLSNKKVSTVYLTNTPTIKIKLTDGKIYETDNPRMDNFKETMLKSGVRVSENAPSNTVNIVFMSAFMISIISLIVGLVKSSNVASRGMLSVDSLDTSATEDIPFNFNSVAGNEEAKESVMDVVDFIKNPEKYSSYGARMPRGIILYGEPGTGKTLLAKAVAGEANVPFYAMSGSDFVQVYVGVGASRIRQLFKKARGHGKAVIFIDEIDAIGKKRENSKNGGSDERDQTLNALLTEMSGFNEKEGIIIMAATNRLDMLDEALLRPGRFDRHIEVSLPDLSARKKILSLHLKNKPTNNIDIENWSHKTAYFSGAKLESLVNEAAIIACKENSSFIENSHLDKAYSIVMAGYEKQNRDYIKEKDRKITAYHEAGHALVSLKTLPNERVDKVTIIPSTKGAGGYTISIPEDSMYQSKDYLEKRIMVLLGGRAAEDLKFGENSITTGAHSDLKQCTNIAFHMITQYGMGETLGLLNMQQLMDLNINQDKIILECKNLVDRLYKETKELLAREISSLEEISTKLLDKETLHHDELMGTVHTFSPLN
ncbi:ATP-dependent metallopeptidase FtsH/Yme1/Tma family protein [Clostridium sp. MSJ-11]|uniref:ATP-dependent metallopeptidase FtsH/Yme1/Tma family protein n=1 Tax=Clostridium mobile TaxID=2841512 RepID=A0ABS6EKF8_9CLOT|nr:ATP-dependent metallopeptidase FtsH/Yme1/Tma family protein [Clostridium mobile]MBU5485703.1 ATP-dependent metallopeptidase FtsH/Yme1/Tma family protein [Clostridium mobile]